MEMCGRVMLITGAAKRLGRAIALDFAASGAAIAVHYRHSASEAAAVVRQIEQAGGCARAFAAELTDAGQVARLVDQTVEAFGRLDVLIACAAGFRRTPWSQVSEADWDAMIDGNLKSTFLLARQCAGRMDPGSSIVTFGDWSGLRAYRDYLPYCVSKAGVIALTKALALELAPDIRVNCICPGTVLPPDHADQAALDRIRAATPLAKIGSPQEIVAAVRFLVCDSSFTTGVVLPVDGGRLIANSGLY